VVRGRIGLPREHLEHLGFRAVQSFSCAR
jgi:hypothetical protein